MLKNGYEKELCELLNIKEDEYKEKVRIFSNILNYYIQMIRKNSGNDLYGMFSVVFDRLYRHGANENSFISEKCIDRYEKITNNRRCKSTDFDDIIELKCAISDICSFEDLWILEFENDDDFVFDDSMNNVLEVGKTLGKFFLEKTDELYNKLYPNNPSSKNTKEKATVKTIGSKK